MTNLSYGFLYQLPGLLHWSQAWKVKRFHDYLFIIVRARFSVSIQISVGVRQKSKRLETVFN